MNFRELLNKIDEAEQLAAAAPVWTPSPEQKTWLGGANQQDPYILSRMPGQKPPVNWFTDPADQELAKRLGFPAAQQQAAAATGTTTPAQGAADAQSIESAKAKLAQLNALLAKLKPGEKRSVDQLKATQDIAKSGFTGESIDADIARQLIESFGYTQEQIDELSMQDVGDFGRGAWQGATLGTGSNIAAGAKSLFKGTKYKDELAGELKANQEAEKRSPLAYGSGNVAGAIGSSFAIPGAGIGNLAARGAAKLGAGAAGQALAKGATMVGTNLALQKGIDTAVGAHNKDVIGGEKPAGAKTGTTDPRLAKLQKVIGANPDGVMGPETKEKLAAWQQSQGITADGMPGPETYGKAGIKESAAEQYARLRDMIAEMETEQQTDEGVWGSLANVGKNLVGGMKGASVVGQQAAKGAVNAAGKKIGGQMMKATGAERLANKAGAAVAGAAGKVGSAAKAAGGAMARNPVKTALGAAGAAYGLSQLGGSGEQPAGAATGSTTGKKQPGAAGADGAEGAATELDQETMAQISVLMAELAQYDIPEIQQGLVQARQQLAQITGDKNIGSADKPAAAPAAAPAPAASSEPAPVVQATGDAAKDNAARQAGNVVQYK